MYLRRFEGPKPFSLALAIPCSALAAVPWLAWLRYSLQVGLLAVTYFAVAQLGLSMALLVDQVSPVWPSTGVALAATVLLGVRFWPAIMLGAFAANLLANEPAWAAAGIAVGNTLEAVVGAKLLAASGFKPGIERLSDVLALVAQAALFSTAIAATIGTTFLCLAAIQPWSNFFAIWGLWWLGDALGALVVAPALLTLGDWPARLASSERRIEALGMLLCAIAVSCAALAGAFRLTPHYPLNYAIFPIVIWAALRFGQPGSALVCLVASSVAVTGTFHGYGPFVAETVHEGLVLLQLYMFVLSVTGMLIGATATERRHVEAALRQSQQDLKHTLHAASVGTWSWDKLTGKVHWSTELEAIHGLPAGGFSGTFDGFVNSIHPDDRSLVLAEIRHAEASGEPLEIEYRSLHPDGSTHWMAGRGSVELDDSGAPIGMRGTCMDVTVRKNTEAAIMTAEACQVAILDGALDGIITTDADGNIVQFNAAAERIFGRRRIEMIGRPMSELINSSRVGQNDWVSADYLNPGDESPQGQPILVWGRRDDGSEFPAVSTLSHVEVGGSNLWMRHVRDLSQSERAQRYLDAEHAVAHALANASQLAEAAEQILETLCQTLAWDVGVLWLVDPQSHTIGCLELWHRPGITVDQFELASRRSAFPKGIGLPGRVWASGEPVWIFDVTCDDNFPRAAIANREGLHSAAGFPLDIGAELLGCIEFFTCRIRPPDEELLNLLASVSGLISQFIYRRRVEANLHKRQQEFELARRIQQRLLPKSEPGLDHFDIAAGCRPAQEVGGDFFDYLRLPDGRLGIGIGDASGHGIGAALTMAQACASLRTVALVHSDIQQMLTLLNRRLVDDTGGNGFLTLFLAALDPVSGELNYASGGHVPAYLFDGQGAIRQVLTSTGFPLATMADNVYPTGPTIVLHAGELLLLLTDGIVEAFSADGTMFGIERALAIVRTHRHLPAREIIAALWRELDAFSDGPQLDDMTAVILKVHEQV